MIEWYTFAMRKSGRIPTEELRKLYIDEKLSTRQIGARVGKSGRTVVQWLKEAGIQARTNSESRFGRALPDSAILASVRARRKHVVPGRSDIGYKVDGYGYVQIWDEESQCYHKEHRMVMERKLGRPLLPTEDVHHINEIKTDNREENLELKASRSEHLKLHAEERGRTPEGRFPSDGAKGTWEKHACKIAECTREHKGYGLCSEHLRWAKNRDARLPEEILASVPVSFTKCSVNGCERGSASRGLCQPHYSWWRTKGEVPTHLIGETGRGHPPIKTQ
jgi:hypothetical protein